MIQDSYIKANYFQYTNHEQVEFEIKNTIKFVLIKNKRNT